MTWLLIIISHEHSRSACNSRKEIRFITNLNIIQILMLGSLLSFPRSVIPVSTDRMAQLEPGFLSMLFPVASKFQLIYMICVDKLRLSFFRFIFTAQTLYNKFHRPGFHDESLMTQVRVSGEVWTEINRFPWIKISSLGFFSVWDKKFFTNLFAPIRIVSAWPGPNLAAIDRESSIRIKRRKFDILKLGHLKGKTEIVWNNNFQLSSVGLDDSDSILSISLIINFASCSSFHNSYACISDNLIAPCAFAEKRLKW